MRVFRLFAVGQDRTFGLYACQDKAYEDRGTMEAVFPHLVFGIETLDLICTSNFERDLRAEQLAYMYDDVLQEVFKVRK